MLALIPSLFYDFQLKDGYRGYFNKQNPSQKIKEERNSDERR